MDFRSLENIRGESRHFTLTEASSYLRPITMPSTTTNGCLKLNFDIEWGYICAIMIFSALSMGLEAFDMVK